MKTIKEWLEELPEPYRTQAIENIDKEMIDVLDVSLSEAITYAFSWVHSPQGYEYWCSFRDSLED